MLRITNHLEIPDEELEFTYARSGGPGGQNVNKVASKAILRWSLARNATIPEQVKSRLRALFRSRITTGDELVIQSQEFRDQEKNRQACLEKLRTLVKQASLVPKVRRPSKPTRGSKERRLTAKKMRSAVKFQRGRVKED